MSLVVAAAVNGRVRDGTPAVKVWSGAVCSSAPRLDEGDDALVQKFAAA